MLSLLHQFYSLFSRKMLYVETNHQHPRQTILQLFLQGFLLIGIIPITKHPGCFQLLGFFLNDVDSSKCDDTTKESGEFLWMHFILFNDTERSLVILTDKAKVPAVDFRSMLMLSSSESCWRLRLISLNCSITIMLLIL